VDGRMWRVERRKRPVGVAMGSGLGDCDTLLSQELGWKRVPEDRVRCASGEGVPASQGVCGSLE
jgi:hypothetical protein